MARKQARRRKPKKTRQIKLPTIRVGRLIAPLAAVGIVFATYNASLAMLQGQALPSIRIDTPRVF